MVKKIVREFLAFDINIDEVNIPEPQQRRPDQPLVGILRSTIDYLASDRLTQNTTNSLSSGPINLKGVHVKGAGYRTEETGELYT